jgi:cation diffusion facilitator family transporter
MAGADSGRAVVYALAANGAIAATKYGAAAVTGSSSMLAEAVHSTADCGNQLLLLLGMRRARREPTPEHPLGYGKETYFWSFIVALMLFTLGGVFSIYEGWHKLADPQPLSHPLIAIGVLVFGVVAESFSMWGALREIRKLRGSRSLWRWFRASRNAELVVIFGEDLAALLGLALALLAVLATWITGNALFDAMGSIAIGALLIVVAVALAIEVNSLLVGEGVEPEVRREMVAFLEAEPAIERVIDMLSLHMGEDVMVAVKAKMRSGATIDAAVDEINRIEAAFKARFPEVRWVFFEPDVR